MEKIWNAFLNYFRELRRIRWAKSKDSRKSFFVSVTFIVVIAALLFGFSMLIVYLLELMGAM